MIRWIYTGRALLCLAVINLCGCPYVAVDYFDDVFLEQVDNGSPRNPLDVAT